MLTVWSMERERRRKRTQLQCRTLPAPPWRWQLKWGKFPSFKEKINDNFHLAFHIVMKTKPLSEVKGRKSGKWRQYLDGKETLSPTQYGSRLRPSFKRQIKFGITYIKATYYQARPPASIQLMQIWQSQGKRPKYTSNKSTL